ncbi:two-component system response regulator VanR [Mycetocola sp. BIGb0189]|uniref:response regulator transcription factor n=1 Tax=Mycetocola sp. BIGb0189 TaxID=2940604 RepID=UPI0021680123|nr:response regulator transcription factor [Mycetocola sp. BIGb0189]MCS4275294.1 two-component system response regulator VanR [Mycetocola sp. BIGb0189]
MRVLVVEDEPFLAEAISAGLEANAIAVDVVSDGEAALFAIDITEYEVVLLDRDIPVIHGDEVCRRLNQRPERPAILMLTAARALADRVDGLAIGADDYLPKPFEFPELIARVRALSRRRFSARPPVLNAGDLCLDPIRFEATRGGRFIRLARKEFAVLEVLMRDPGTVISAETLLERAWDENANPFTNSVKVTISTLRRKLGEPWLIRTVPGVGYAIETGEPGRETPH